MPAIVAGDVFDSQDFFLPAALYRGWAYQLQHDYPAARTAFEAARRSAQEATRGMLSDWRMHAAIGLALAGLGRQDEARREAEWLRGSDEYLRDANQGTIVARDRAMILAGVGDAADALTEIERLLSRPSYLKPMLLRLDPRWDPIRNHPRFQALLKKYSP